MFPAPREWEATLKERYGDPKASWIINIVVAGAVTAALGIIAGAIVLVATKLFGP